MSTSRKDMRRVAAGIEALAPASRPRDSAAEPRTTKQIHKGRDPWGYRLRTALYTSDSKSRARTLDRMSFPIMGVVGPNGGGKTAAVVAMANEAFEQGRRVLSTCPLLDWRTGLPHPLYVPWTHWDQLLDWWDGDVFADEILSIASSRGSASLDPRAQTLLVQLRKRNARFWWTAPSAARADVIIREVTQAITECRGYYANRAGREERRGVIQSWDPKRLFAFRTYDATEFDDWTAGKRESATPLVTEWFKGPGSNVFKSYDTLGAVNIIASVSDAGVCLNCDGVVSNKRKACRCAHPEVVPLADLSTLTRSANRELAAEAEPFPIEAHRHGVELAPVDVR